jgi:hypothetical protein
LHSHAMGVPVLFIVETLFTLPCQRDLKPVLVWRQCYWHHRLGIETKMSLFFRKEISSSLYVKKIRNGKIKIVREILKAFWLAPTHAIIRNRLIIYVNYVKTKILLYKCIYLIPCFWHDLLKAFALQIKSCVNGLNFCHIVYHVYFSKKVLRIIKMYFCKNAGTEMIG